MNELRVNYEANGTEISLTSNMVSQFITKGNGEITEAEAVNFMMLCKGAQLNPFLNDAYLIKFGNQPAQMVVSKEAVLKRASRQKDYEGMGSGIVVINKDGSVIHKRGTLVYPNEQLIGAWAEVYRSDFRQSIYAEVAFEEYNTGKSTWAKMPSNMINKVAQNKALREAYPEQLGGMYTEEEPTINELENVSHTDNQGEILQFEHNEPLTNDAPDIAERVKELRKEVKEAKKLKTLKAVDELVAEKEGVSDIGKLTDFAVMVSLKELLIAKDDEIEGGNNAI